MEALNGKAVWREFKVLATNELNDAFMASPAVAGRAFIVRTKTHMYRIES